MPSKEQDSCRFAGVIGGLPVPGARGIGGAEGSFHRGAQAGGIDAAAAFEVGQKLPRSPYDGGSNNCCGTDRERRGGVAAEKRFGHDRFLRRGEWGEPPGTLLRPRRLRPFPARLSLSTIANKNGDRRRA